MTDTDRLPIQYGYMRPVPAFTLVSDDIVDGGTVPDAHVHDGIGGGNLSPHLRWEGFPPETKGFAVNCYDPDAPTGGGFWHWTAFDIPAGVTELPTGAGSGDFAGLPAGVTQARNDFGPVGYGGCYPPPGDPHRYVFAVHALDVGSLGPDADASPNFVGFNLGMHVIARALLVPVYEAS